MLYRTLERLVKRGRVDGLEERLDIFYALGKLTEEEYKELLGFLKHD